MRLWDGLRFSSCIRLNFAVPIDRYASCDSVSAQGASTILRSY